MELKCPHCKNDDKRLIELTAKYRDKIVYTCDVCCKTWEDKGESNER